MYSTFVADDTVNHADTPYTDDDIDRLSSMPRVLPWEDLPFEKRLAVCLREEHAQTWLEPHALSTFVHFRTDGEVWAKIQAAYREVRGDPRILEHAVDAYVARTTAHTPAVRISARQLKQTTYPPVIEVVEEILPAGCTLCTGKSKDGKSLLAYNIAVAVASGGLALGRYKVMPGAVWYLALEDNERRAKQRLELQEAQMGSLPEEAQDRLHFTCWDAPRLGQGLEIDIRAWVDQTPNARLIIIDILEKVRPPRKFHGNIVTEDYGATAPLTRLAQEHNIAILVIHHANKLKSDDFRDSVSGAMSLLGGADNYWNLRRPALGHEGILTITGRDITKEQELVLCFQDGYWTVAFGDVAFTRLSPERLEIVEVLQASPKPMTSKQVADQLEKPYNNIRKLMMMMAQAGLLLQPTLKHYALSSRFLTNTGNSGNSGNSGNTGNRKLAVINKASTVTGAVTADGGVESIDFEEVTPTVTGVTTVTAVIAGVQNTPAAWECVHCHGTVRWYNAGNEPVCSRCHPRAS